jgi:hypothetical protein
VYKDLATLGLNYPEAVTDAIKSNQISDLVGVSTKNITEELYSRAHSCFDEAVALSKDNQLVNSN